MRHAGLAHAFVDIAGELDDRCPIDGRLADEVRHLQVLDDAAVDLVRLRAEVGERRPLFLDPLLRPLVHQRAHLLFDLIQQPDGFVEAQSGDVHRMFRLSQVVQQRFDTRGLDADPFGLDALADAQLEVQIFGRLHRLRPGREAHGAHHG